MLHPEDSQAPEATFALASGHVGLKGGDLDYQYNEGAVLGGWGFAVRELDDQRVAITGFMLPTKFKNGRVTEFLLMKDQSGCCFGAMPRINEWIIVKMMNDGVPPLMDMPLTFVGKLKVGEVFEEGYLAGIYQLEGEKLMDVRG